MKNEYYYSEKFEYYSRKNIWTFIVNALINMVVITIMSFFDSDFALFIQVMALLVFLAISVWFILKGIRKTHNHHRVFVSESELLQYSENRKNLLQ